jgi:hypothetical protein
LEKYKDAQALYRSKQPGEHGGMKNAITELKRKLADERRREAEKGNKLSTLKYARYAPKKGHPISSEWHDIPNDVSPAELDVMVQVFAKHGWPAHVSATGNQPIDEQDSWGSDVLESWDEATDEALDTIEAYRKYYKGKDYLSLSESKERVRDYVSRAFTHSIKRDPSKYDPSDVWGRMSHVERLWMINDGKLANTDGTPTAEARKRGALIHS